MRVVMLLALALVTISGCGGASPAAPSPSTPSPPTSPLTFTGSVNASGYTSHAISVSGSGTMTVTLTWQSSLADLDLYLTDQSCSAYPLLSCTVLEQSTAPTGSSESVSRSVSPGQTFKAWVDSYATTSTPYTVSVMFR